MVAVWFPSPAALLPPAELRTPPLLGAASHPLPHHQYILASSPVSPDFSRPLYPPSPGHMHSHSHSHLASPGSLPKAVPSRSSGGLSKLAAGSRSPAKKVFPCPFPGCAQTSSNKGNLSKHIATRHEHRKDYHCPVAGCTKQFAKKFNMLRHLCSSSVHRRDARKADRIIGKSARRAQRRAAKWSSMELDLANFLAAQCQSPVTSATESM